MELRPRPLTRRAFVLSAAGTRALAQSGKGALFPSEWRRYNDPSTELIVYRLTDPAHTSSLPAYYQRAVARRGGFLLFTSDRAGSPQVFRMDLKTGECRQLTDAKALDPASVALQPDERGFCYFDGPALRQTNFTNVRDREVYRAPAGWERCPGGTLADDGSFAAFGERREGRSRLRVVGLGRGAARTVTEQAWELSDPLPRPRRAQILYRQGDAALWLVNSDGRRAHSLKLADGRVGPAAWAPDGKTILYLHFPADKTQLNAIREYSPDQDSDKLVAKTSQFEHFGFNRDTSVFVGASRSAASPTVLLLLRLTRRELTLCEHRASSASIVAPVFSPDSQRVFFESDRHGKPAIYCIHVERLVEETAS
jgi:oligogalacturonide lyase